MFHVASIVRGKVINLRVPLDLKGNKDLSTEYGSKDPYEHN